MKILLLFSCIMLILFGCTQPEKPPGSDRDAHGCIASAGYSWCDGKQKCLRQWEEPCESSLSPSQARAIAENSNCTKQGTLSQNMSYNNNSRTWWIDIDVVKLGCTPSCVVFESNKTTGINWRCTGLIPPK